MQTRRNAAFAAFARIPSEDAEACLYQSCTLAHQSFCLYRHEGQGYLVLTPEEAHNAASHLIASDLGGFDSEYLLDFAPDGTRLQDIEAAKASGDPSKLTALMIGGDGQGIQRLTEESIKKDGLFTFLGNGVPIEHESNGFLIYETNERGILTQDS